MIKPMTLEEYIQVACLTYPTLYRDPFMDETMWPLARRAVLSHMFLTLGNGMEWREGVLEPWSMDKMELMALKAIRSVHPKKREQKILEVRKAVALDHHMSHPKLYKNLDERGLYNFNKHEHEYLKMIGQEARIFSPYPFGSPHRDHKIGQLFEIPDDIKMDYLAGIFEIMELVISSPLKDEDNYLKQYAQEWVEVLTLHFYEPRPDCPCGCTEASL